MAITPTYGGETEYYNLAKPNLSDKPDIGVINANMDILDEALHDVADDLDNKAYLAATNLGEVASLTELNNKLLEVLATVTKTQAIYPVHFLTNFNSYPFKTSEAYVAIINTRATGGRASVIAYRDTGTYGGSIVYGGYTPGTGWRWGKLYAPTYDMSDKVVGNSNIVNGADVSVYHVGGEFALFEAKFTLLSGKAITSSPIFAYFTEDAMPNASLYTNMPTFTALYTPSSSDTPYSVGDATFVATTYSGNSAYGLRIRGGQAPNNLLPASATGGIVYIRGIYLHQ